MPNFNFEVPLPPNDDGNSLELPSTPELTPTGGSLRPEVSYTSNDTTYSPAYAAGECLRAATGGRAVSTHTVDYATIVMTLPLWLVTSLAALILLIHYLRKIQYCTLYDKCAVKNAHFAYDFQVILGKSSITYTERDSTLIVDLLDVNLVSLMTIQIPAAHQSGASSSTQSHSMFTSSSSSFL